MKVSDAIAILEKEFPLEYQESYDNAGLIIGSSESELTSVLICLDVTEAVITEAIKKKCNLIISHHPLIFDSLKKISRNNPIGVTIYAAIQNNISIYACHTNLDNAFGGLNWHIAGILGLENIRPLFHKHGTLLKLVTFCPLEHIDKVRSAVFSAGAGHIGNYDSCSFNLEGAGSFRALENAKPFVGSKNKLHFEKEIRLETLFPEHLQKGVIEALLRSHPYEEVAYDIYTLKSINSGIGSGIIGQLPKDEKPDEFLSMIKSKFRIQTIRHTFLPKRKIKNIALCGGAGGFLIPEAIKNKADMFLTADLRYHDFFVNPNSIILADIGHYESEQFATELIFSTLRKKMPNFALVLSRVNTNPIRYF